MLRTSLLVITSLSGIATLPAQDILHYSFGDAYGTKATNYAVGSPAPAVGTIVSQLTTPSWVPGRYGAALAGGQASPNLPNRVDTGWVPGTYTGSFSYALWIKLARGQTTPSIFYAFGQATSGSFRVFSGTSGIVFTTGFGSSTSSVANVGALAAAGWTHLAFVADATTLTGTYYVNGVAEAPKTIVNPTWTSNVPFTIGQQLTTSPGSIWDIDEFLFTRRVLTAADIALLATRPLAGDAPYGGGCGNLTLANGGSLPKVGNLTYQVTLNSPTPLSYSLGIGTNRANLGPVPLPFDLGTIIGGIGTCLIDCSLDVANLPGAKPAGSINLALPVPNDMALDGTVLFLQVPGIGSTNPIDVSNAFSIGIGH